MKTAIFCLCLIFCGSAYMADAQVNLVLNPSFEQYSICPWQFGQIQIAYYWTPIDTTGNYLGPGAGGGEGIPLGTPYYINGCAEDSFLPRQYCGEPFNGYFYHYPRTGNGMVENMMYFNESLEDPERRNYTQGRLSNVLSEGTSYCVTFYVANEQVSSYGINHIGAYLDNGNLDIGMDTLCCAALYPYTGWLDTNSAQPLQTLLGIIPQVYATSIISDTLGWATFDSSQYAHRWVKIQGSFIANGSERYITIGNFFTASNTDTVSITSQIPLYINDHWSYYLIDDVSVVRSDAVADAGPDITTSPGYPVWIGNDTAAVGGGDGMPCWWYPASGGTGGPAIDSGGRIQVSPDTTTTYVMMMDLCGNITYDTVTVWVWPLTSPNPSKGGGLEREVLLSPNPLSSLTPNVTISGNVAGCRYQVMNSIGQVLLQGVLQGNKNDIDVSAFLPGVYLVNLSPSPVPTGQALSKGEGGIIRRKLIKL